MFKLGVGIFQHTVLRFAGFGQCLCLRRGAAQTTQRQGVPGNLHQAGCEHKLTHATIAQAQCDWHILHRLVRPQPSSQFPQA